MSSNQDSVDKSDEDRRLQRKKNDNEDPVRNTY